MADVVFSNLGDLITAAGGVGAAAYGFVDASKSIAGGMSNPGFGHVKAAMRPLLPPGSAVMTPEQVEATLYANWINGRAKAEQKAVAKALIKLRLCEDTVGALAQQTSIKPEVLTAICNAIATGTPLTTEETNAMGQFEIVVGAKLDAGYERADQLYRNAAKAGAFVVAMLLALAAIPIGGLPWSQALAVGILGGALAPVAKDATSFLSQGVTALRGLRR